MKEMFRNYRRNLHRELDEVETLWGKTWKIFSFFFPSMFLVCFNYLLFLFLQWLIEVCISSPHCLETNTFLNFVASFMGVVSVLSMVACWFVLSWLSLSSTWFLLYLVAEKVFEKKWKANENNLSKIEKWTNFCKYIKLISLTIGLISAGLALKNESKNAGYLAFASSSVGIVNEAVKDLVLEPQKEKLIANIINDLKREILILRREDELTF